MKWLKLYPKAWRERYEEEFFYVYSKSSIRGMWLRMDMLKHFLFVWIDELAFKKGKRDGGYGNHFIFPCRLCDSANAYFVRSGFGRI